ncbi:MAG: hypothetical protein ABW110_13360 [Steroidobacteraceae bacterium]
MNKRQQALHRKRLAYVRTFCGDGDSPHEDGKRVLADLKRFCGINQGGIVISPVSRVVDSHATVYRAALRDAYLRIVGFLDLEETDIEEDSTHVETTPASAG